VFPEKQDRDQGRGRRLEIEEERTGEARDPAQAEHQEDRSRYPSGQDRPGEPGEVAFFERRLFGAPMGPAPASGASGRAAVGAEPQESPGIEKPGQRDRRDPAEEELGQGNAHAEKDGRGKDGDKRPGAHWL
jgi:hypothetical protein